MFTRLRTTWLASGGALLLALSLSGAVAAAALVSAITAPPAETVDADAPVVADTTLTFEDADGDGVDDDCDEEVVDNEPAASAATAAVDLNADGVISTSEAAQSGRTGGTNCNHGGYVSTVAQATDETEETVDPEVAVECETETAPVVEPVVEEPVVEEPVDTAKNAHGKAVMAVAQDKEAVGGKNCNHGGAVSEAAKKDVEAREAAKEAREAAKADKVKKAKTHGKHSH
jgi:hypothetical protein